MISIKSAREIDKMRRAGDILARCVEKVAAVIVEGATSGDADRIAAEFIRSCGAQASFFGQECMTEGGPRYPATVCVSVNEEVIHGIPGARRFKSGDIVSIDVGACIDGYHSDMARTYCVGEVSQAARDLVRVTEECFWQGIMFAVPGKRVSDISAGVQSHAERAGYSVVRDYCGHGIGAWLHEDPQIPNSYAKGEKRGERLTRGMTMAVEPMVNAGAPEVTVMPNKWTVVTKDGSMSAHYENTILITEKGPVILSAPI